MVVDVHIPVEQALGEDFGLTPSDLPLYSLHPNGSLWDGVVKRFVYSGIYLDELSITVAPVVLGGGKRLFEGFDDTVRLEHIDVLQSPFATHILYRVVR
jgi:hypothetical protein